MKLNVSLKKDDKAKKNDNSKVASSDKKDKEPIDKKDIFWYAGSIFFLILAFLPVLLRNFDPNYDINGKSSDDEASAPKKEVKTERLLCSKTFEEEGYSYKVDIANVYRNKYVDNAIITYVVTIDPAYNVRFEEIEIPEYKTLSEMEEKGISVSLEGQSYIVRIDYALNPGLSGNEMLQNHNKPLDDQRSTYQSNGYVCTVE